MTETILIRRAIAWALVFAALSLPLSAAGAAQGDLAPGNICERHIAEAETKLNIPRQILLAIGVVESGVWNEKRARSTPWPWTVYAQKRDRRFASLEEAIAEV